MNVSKKGKTIPQQINLLKSGRYMALYFLISRVFLQKLEE